MTFEELLAELEKQLKEASSGTKFMTWLGVTKDPHKADSKNLAQDLIDQGHGIATSQLKGERDTLQAKLNKAEADLHTANQRIQQLSAAGGTDVQKLTEDYRKDVQDRENQITGLKTRLHDVQISIALGDVERLLRDQVDDVWLALQFTRPDIRGRVKPSDDGTSYQILKEAGSAIPLAAPQGKTQLQAFAEELFNSAPDARRKLKMDKGSGNNAGGRQTSDNGTSGNKDFEERKKQAQAEVSALRPGRSTGPSLEERLGKKRATAVSDTE